MKEVSEERKAEIKANRQAAMAKAREARKLKLTEVKEEPKIFSARNQTSSGLRKLTLIPRPEDPLPIIPAGILNRG